MKKYIVFYHTTTNETNRMDNMTQEQQAQEMKPWLDWKKTVGNHLVDFGSPLNNATRVLPDGTTQRSDNDVTGYSIIQANDLDEAKTLLRNHPLLNTTSGSDIEILECTDMDS